MLFEILLDLVIAAQLGKLLMYVNGTLYNNCQKLLQALNGLKSTHIDDLTSPSVASSKQPTLKSLQRRKHSRNDVQDGLYELEQDNDTLYYKVDTLKQQLEEERKRSDQRIVTLKSRVRTLEEELATTHGRVEELENIQHTGSSRALGSSLSSAEKRRLHSGVKEIHEQEVYILHLEFILSELHEDYSSSMTELTILEQENKELEQQFLSLERTLQTCRYLKEACDAQGQHLTELEGRLKTIGKGHQDTHFGLHYSDLYTFGWSESETLLEEFEATQFKEERVTISTLPFAIDQLSTEAHNLRYKARHLPDSEHTTQLRDILPATHTTYRNMTHLQQQNAHRGITGHLLRFVQLWIKLLYFLVVYIVLGLYGILFSSKKIIQR
jgi:chromosome segregation ATPase